MKTAHAGQLLLMRLGRRVRVLVRGASMEPALSEGDEVLVDPRAYRRSRPSVGDVVLFTHPIQSDVTALKRVAERREGGLWLLGDNARQSTDSRSYGAVPDRKVIGKVVARI